MKHALRKYLSQRGSALFMVLSLMTALMVLVMAMYFSVVASRDIQYKVFYTEQSYRSAVSLSDAIISGLRTNKWDNTGGTAFRTAIENMTVGSSISTNGNNFAAFLGTGTEEDNQLGAYTVTITRLENEGSVQLYDMAITVSVGGVVDTTHTFFKVSVEQFDVEGPDRTFTSTGYSPNDVYLEAGTYTTDMFFDNQYTIIGGYDHSDVHLNGNVISGGSVRLEYQSGTQADRPLTWAIRDTLYIKDTSALELGYNGERGLVMVGRDYYCMGSVPDNCDIYVLGDLYYLSSQVFDNNVRLFVNGNIYIDESGQTGSLPSGYRCNGRVIDNTSRAEHVDDPDDWVENEANGIMSVKKMKETLNGMTASQTFYKWEINSTKPKDDDDNPRNDYIEELDTRSASSKGSTDALEIIFNHGNTTGPDGTQAGTAVYEIPWDPKTKSDYFGDGMDLTYSAHVIKEVALDKGGSSGINDVAIIIDTGDDPNNQHFIKVLPNRDWDGDDAHEKETFCWNPAMENPTDKPSTCDTTIIIRGRGSVVVVVPEGVVYQDGYRQKVMHQSWYCLLGGTITNTTENCEVGGTWQHVPVTIYDSEAIVNGFDSVSTADRTTSFIHTVCDETCTSCNYTVNRSPYIKNPATGKIIYKAANGTLWEDDPAKGDPIPRVCNKEYTDGTKCEGTIVEVYCPRHEYTYSFCDTCEHEPALEDEDDPDSYYGLCVNRIDRDAVDGAVNSLGTNEKAAMYDASNNIVYPTVNYFIVSSDESADIRCSGALTPEGMSFEIQHNMLYGFIYAPYMTFTGVNGNSGAGGKMVKFCGGMIVSDYVLSDTYATVNCFPEYMPTDLVSEENQKERLTSFAGRDWKISLAGY